MERLRAEPFDLLLMDLNYTRDTTSGREGLELIPRVRAHDPALPIVVMTGWGSIDTAVEAMRRGARSFVQKPWEDVTLLEILQREIAEARAARRRDQQPAARVRGRAADPARPAADRRAADCRHRPRRRPGSRPTASAATASTRSAFGSALGVSIADIAGKGLPAALLMSNLQAAVRAFAQEAAAPGVGLRAASTACCAATWRAAASPRSATRGSSRDAGTRSSTRTPGTIRRCSCAPTARSTRLAEGGMVLGVFPEIAYEQAELALAPGDRLVFYTDGITEARNAGRRGVRRGARSPRSRSRPRALPVEAMKDALLADVNGFTGGQFEDDATLIVVGL